MPQSRCIQPEWLVYYVSPATLHIFYISTHQASSRISIINSTEHNTDVESNGPTINERGTIHYIRRGVLQSSVAVLKHIPKSLRNFPPFRILVDKTSTSTISYSAGVRREKGNVLTFKRVLDDLQSE
jgi:hypothetical protein